MFMVYTHQGQSLLGKPGPHRLEGEGWRLVVPPIDQSSRLKSLWEKKLTCWSAPVSSRRCSSRSSSRSRSSPASLGPSSKHPALSDTESQQGRGTTSCTGSHRPALMFAPNKWSGRMFTDLFRRETIILGAAIIIYCCYPTKHIEV